MTNNTELMLKHLDMYEQGTITLRTLQNKSSLAKAEVDRLELIIEDYYSDEDEIAEAENLQEIELNKMVCFTALVGVLRRAQTSECPQKVLNELRNKLTQ